VKSAAIPIARSQRASAIHPACSSHAAAKLLRVEFPL
jgi:hypothetical protein